MSGLYIPVQAQPSQTLRITLNQQSCRINLYSKEFSVRQADGSIAVLDRLFLDLFVQEVPIIFGAICFDRNKLVRDAYLGFIGDLFFFDILGVSDPAYQGLGTQYFLGYGPDLL